MSFDLDGLRVFLSGPMSAHGADGDWNRDAFTEAAMWCANHGAVEVFDPADGAPKGPDCHSHEHWMRSTLHELTRWENGMRYEDNRPHYDVLMLLDGWWRSDGANAERMVANACGIEVMELREAMKWAEEDGDD
jgi:hypothetical protein